MDTATAVEAAALLVALVAYGVASDRERDLVATARGALDSGDPGRLKRAAALAGAKTHALIATVLLVVLVSSPLWSGDDVAIAVIVGFVVGVVAGWWVELARSGAQSYWERMAEALKAAAGGSDVTEEKVARVNLRHGRLLEGTRAERNAELNHLLH